jgi:radical SAM protein with 4Fe4S-binding SPASM domain
MLYAGFARENWDKIGYTPEQYVDFWKKAFDYCLELNRRGKYFIEGTSVIIARKLLSREYQSYTCMGNPCGAGLSQTSYNYDGSIYACDEAKSFDIFKIGDVRKDSYKEVYASPRTLNIVSLSSGVNFLCDSCVWHPYCNSCMVSTYGSQGTPIPKLPMDTECKVRGAQIEHVFKTLTSSPENRKILLRWCSTNRGV